MEETVERLAQRLAGEVIEIASSMQAGDAALFLSRVRRHLGRRQRAMIDDPPFELVVLNGR